MGDKRKSSGKTIKTAAKNVYGIAVFADKSRNISGAAYIELPSAQSKKDDMAATWIVSANAGRARFFSQDTGSNAVDEVNDMVNSSVRLRTEETESDKIGPTAATKSIHNVGGPTPNKTYEPPQTPTEHQTELFARNIAEFLLQGLEEGRFGQLILAASPEFLGTLRKLLDPRITSVMSAEVNKDYTQFSGRQLLEQIQAHVAKSA